MASTGLLVGVTSGAIINDSGTVSFTNPANALADDGSFATSSGSWSSFGTTSKALYTYDFPVVIPVGATIVGIEAGAGCFKTGGTCIVGLSEAYVYRHATTPPGTSQASKIVTAGGIKTVPSSEGYIKLGSSTDDWGQSTSIANWNSGIWSVALKFVTTSLGTTTTVSVDYIGLEIFYSTPGKAWVKDGGTWKEGDAYIKDAGTWKQAANGLYIKDAGTWKQTV